MFSLQSYQAVQGAGGVVRRTDRGVLAVSGTERAAWLQGLLTNDVSRLVEDQPVYAAYLTPQGRMISDMFVVASSDRILLDVPASLAESLRTRLDGLIFSEDVQVAADSGTCGVWTVITPGDLVEVVAPALPAPYRGLPEIDLGTFDVIRIERGVPRFLVDMFDDTIPLEAGIEDRAISFTKGCYVGQEVIVRVTHRGGGRVAKKLVRWMADDSASIVPLEEARIEAAGKDVGRVTSAAFSPARSKVVGLGYVHRDSAEAGTELTITWNGTRLRAVVS